MVGLLGFVTYFSLVLCFLYWVNKSVPQKTQPKSKSSSLTFEKIVKQYKFPKGCCQKCGSIDTYNGGSWTPECCRVCGELYFDHEGY